MNISDFLNSSRKLSYWPEHGVVPNNLVLPVHKKNSFLVNSPDVHISSLPIEEKVPPVLQSRGSEK